jgi:glutaredoxin
MNVAFSEYDVSRDRTAAMEMVNLTGQMGVPVVVVDGQPVIGFNRPMLQELLSKGNGRQRPRLGMKVTDADRSSRRHLYSGQLSVRYRRVHRPAVPVSSPVILLPPSTARESITSQNWRRLSRRLRRAAGSRSRFIAANRLLKRK